MTSPCLDDTYDVTDVNVFVCKFMRFLRKRSRIVSPLTTVIKMNMDIGFNDSLVFHWPLKTHVLSYELFNFLGLFLQCF